LFFTQTRLIPYLLSPSSLLTSGKLNMTPIMIPTSASGRTEEPVISTRHTSARSVHFPKTWDQPREYQQSPEGFLEDLANRAIKLLNEAVELLQKDLADAEKTLSKAQELRSRVFLALPEESSNYSDSIYQKVLFRCEEVELHVQRFRKAADDY